MYDKSLLDTIYIKNNVSMEAQEFRNAHLKSFYEVDFPSWNRLKVDNTSVIEYKDFNNQKYNYKNQDGLKIESIFNFDNEELLNILKFEYGTSKKHRLLTEIFSNSGLYIELQKDTKVINPIIIESTINKENPVLLDHHIIYAGQGSEVTIVIDYKDDDVDGYQNGVINVIAEKNASVKIVKIQNLSKRTTHISSGLSLLNRGSHVQFSSIDLGSRIAVTDYSTYLLDENAKSDVDSIYLGDGRSKFDLGYNIYHEGRRSKSDIVVKGALLDESRKVFRGNLFFKKGSKRSEGSEQEFVILLDDRVKSDSIPALMCDEDDVQGEHACSAGQVDENKLFYLMSRGLSKKEAKQLIIMASFTSVTDKLPIHGMQDRISDEISLRLEQN